MSGVTRVAITAEPTGPDSPAAVAAAAAAAKATETQTPETPAKAEKPKWLPEKFWNAEKGEANYEGLASSYGSLEKKLGEKKPDAAKPEAKEGEKPAEGDANEAAKEAVTAAGLDFDGLSNEFYSTGELSKDSRAKIVAAGIPEPMIDSYLAGVSLQVAEFSNSVAGTVGGAEQYAAMTAWAQANLSDDDVAAYNKAVTSGDYHRAVTAAKALKADFVAANGSEPNLVGGKKPGGGESDVYASWSQVTADMRKPEYKRDAAFRAQVEAKLARSKV